MYTVRELITEAFRKSTVRGLTDTPESDEIKQALSTLNTDLDQLTAREEFSTSKRAVRASVGPLGYVTVSDNPARIVVNAVSSGPNEARITTLSEHGITVGDHIALSHEFYDDFPDGAVYFKHLEVIYVGSPFAFKVRTRSGLISGVKSGTFKLSSQGPEYDIDIIDCPPDNIYQVVDSEGLKLPELQEQDFYAYRDRRDFAWYFYDKSRNPYPKIWVGGRSAVTIVYQEPFWHDLKLDTDLTAMPRSALACLKYALSRDLAEENGYLDIAQRMDARYRESYADYVRSVAQSASPLPDVSAPGYLDRPLYNIENDGIGNGWLG
jgi:hypothetical protein